MLSQSLRPLEFLKSLRTQTNIKDTEVHSGREQGCESHRAPPSGQNEALRRCPEGVDCGLQPWGKAMCCWTKMTRRARETQEGTPPVSNSETNNISSPCLLLPILCQRRIRCFFFFLPLLARSSFSDHPEILKVVMQFPVFVLLFILSEH